MKTLIIKLLIILVIPAISTAQINAYFTADTLFGCNSATIKFNNESSGNFTSAYWDFGNGNNSEELGNVDEGYNEPGIYKVTLTIKDASNNQHSYSKDVTIYHSPVAKFTMPDNDGCTNHNFEFQNASELGDAPLVKYEWFLKPGVMLFGDTINYVYGGSPDLYNVQFTVTDANGCVGWTVVNDYVKTSSISNVEISSLPEKPCVAPVDVELTASYNSSENIESFSWDFGNDSTIETSESVQSVKYTEKNNYDINLTVTDTYGCKKTTVLKYYINENSSDSPMFTIKSNPTSTCSAPADVEISRSNITSKHGIVSYSWDFDNGETSNSEDETQNITFTKDTSYNISLTVLDKYGCSTTKTTKFEVTKYIADFDIDSASLVSCVGEYVKFKNNSNTSNVKYIYGDGESGTGSIYKYETPGLYDVRIIAGYNSECADTSSAKQIYIPEVVAYYTFDAYMCQVPDSVQFTDSSTGAIDQWAWEIGNEGKIDTLQNPWGIYNIDDILYYEREHRYITKLTVTDTNGCSDEYEHPDSVEIKLPTALLSSDNQGGLVPVDVEFSDHSILYGDVKIVSREWHFGDSTSSLGNDSTILHTYNKGGEHYAKIIIKTDEGCTDTSEAIKIKNADVDFDNANFSCSCKCNGGKCGINDKITCADSYVEFDVQTALSDIDVYHFEFESGNGKYTSVYNSSPKWKFNTDTGWMDVKVTVGIGSEYGGIIFEDLIYVNAPIALIDSTSYECSNPLEYKFFSKIIGADTIRWDFGDETTPVNTENPMHRFDSSGDYTVTLFAENYTTGCTYLDTIAIKVREIKAGFSMNEYFIDTIRTCIGSNIKFNSTTSIDENFTCNEAYKWFFKNPAELKLTSDTLIEYIFNTSGIHPVKLVVEDVNYCTDTLTKYVKIDQLNSDFELSQNSGCPPFDISFTDISETLSEANIVERIWEIEDSVYIDTNSVKIVNHSFEKYIEKTYKPKLTIVTDLGCTSSKTKSIVATIPSADFSITGKDKLCSNVDELKVRANYSGLKYTWYVNGSSFTSVSKDTSYTFVDTAGTFVVSLKVEDNYLCVDSTSQKVHVQNADASYDLSPSDTLCYPALVHFTPDFTNGTHKWDLGNNQSSTQNSTFNYYNSPMFSDSLRTSHIFTTSYGCKDTVVNYLKVEGPYAEFIIGIDSTLDSICKGDELKFSLTSQTPDLKSFEWYFGDGTTYEEEFGELIHYKKFIKDSTGWLYPKVFLTSSNCKAVPSPYKDSLYVNNVIARLDISPDVVGCFKDFYPTFVNESSNATYYNINLGDGNETTERDYTHEYSEPGVFNTVLSIYEPESGCRDTVKQDITVNALPSINISADNDICYYDFSKISASTDIKDASYNWYPNIGLSKADISNPVASPDSSTLYNLMVTNNETGCKSTDSIHMFVQQTSSIEDAFPIGLDTTIVIGEIVNINIITDKSVNTSFDWYPKKWLSCYDCPNPVAKPLETTTYTLKYNDPMGCDTNELELTINVEAKYSIDIPDVFTPNGDGENDIIFAKGWGIEEIIEFKIYNRWGQVVFENPNDLSIGWDGTFKGKPQNIDTYIAVIKVKYYLDGGEDKLEKYIHIIK